MKTHGLERGIFVFPWDFSRGGIDSTLHTLQSIGCTSFLLSSGYHYARHLHPLWPGPITNDRVADGLCFSPNPDFYPDGLTPPLAEDYADGRIELEAREKAAATSMTFGSWVMGLHNSTLGMRRPDLLAQNAFGDIFGYSLCPANPDVRDYTRGLIQDIGEKLNPEIIALESVTFLPWQHGSHHELALLSLGEPAWQLLSLCFCKSCKAWAARENIDADALQTEVRTAVRQLLEDERGRLDPAFTQMEMASLLLEWPDLAAYLRMRLNVVTSLNRDLKKWTQSKDIKLAVMPAIFPRHTASMSWAEGVSLRDLPSGSDSTLLLSYFPRQLEVEADIRWLKLMAPDHPFSLGLDAGSRGSPTEQALIDAVQTASAEGATGVYYYNYGLLNRSRLESIGRANSKIT
jgi:hypothetical protein